jgi:succinoglycan biosynthesis protein ExoM
MIEQKDSNQKLVSVCICTYKRFESLLNTINSVIVQKLPENYILELIVVDNDPNSTAKENVKFLIENNEVKLYRFEYFIEAKRGVANARNRCLDEARGELVAFIDDDEIASTNWLSNLISLIKNSQADAVFGPVCSKFVTEPDNWLKHCGVHNRPRFQTGTKITWKDAKTGNVLFKTNNFFKNQRFNIKYTKTGGEDSFFFAQAYLSGANFFWCDEAVVNEEVPIERMTKKWVLRRAFYGGRTYTKLQLDLFGKYKFLVSIFRGFIAVLIYAPIAFFAWLFGHPNHIMFLCKMFGGMGKVAYLNTNGIYADS